MNDYAVATPRKREGGTMDLSVMAPRPHRFTSDEYHAMACHEIIPLGARAELLDGLIVERLGSPRTNSMRSPGRKTPASSMRW
jgi:hypothetical protein